MYSQHPHKSLSSESYCKSCNFFTGKITPYLTSWCQNRPKQYYWYKIGVLLLDHKSCLLYLDDAATELQNIALGSGSLTAMLTMKYLHSLINFEIQETHLAVQHSIAAGIGCDGFKFLQSQLDSFWRNHNRKNGFEISGELNDSFENNNNLVRYNCGVKGHRWSDDACEIPWEFQKQTRNGNWNVRRRNWISLFSIVL